MEHQESMARARDALTSRRTGDSKGRTERRGSRLARGGCGRKWLSKGHPGTHPRQVAGVGQGTKRAQASAHPTKLAVQVGFAVPSRRTPVVLSILGGRHLRQAHHARRAAGSLADGRAGWLAGGKWPAEVENKVGSPSPWTECLTRVGFLHCASYG